MKCLIVDHHDSFTYNIVRYFQAVSEIEIDVVSYENATLNAEIDLLLLSPGPKWPSDYPQPIQLIDH